MDLAEATAFPTAPEPAEAPAPAPLPAPRVLLVDGGSPATAALAGSLREAGFSLTQAADALAGCAALERLRIDALVVDLDQALPLDGCPAPHAGLTRDPATSPIELMRRARQADTALPVLALAAAPALAARVQAIEWGADDYLVKPVPPDDLVVLLRARVHRRRAESADRLRAGHLELDLRHQHVSADGRPVALTAREFALLTMLVEAGGRTVARAALQERLGAWGGTPASNAVDVHVHRIRRKVGRENIHTFRGGYAVAA